jgi:hypothetical protein
MFSPRPVPIDAGQVPAMRIAGFFISAEPAPNKGENNQRNSQNAKQRHGFCSHCWGRIDRDIVTVATIQ